MRNSESYVHRNVRHEERSIPCPRCGEGYIVKHTSTWLGCWSGNPDNWEPESEIDTEYIPCDECGNDDPDYEPDPE